MLNKHGWQKSILHFSIQQQSYMCLCPNINLKSHNKTKKVNIETFVKHNALKID